ncbi:GntR family transcriptional regulator [Streptomyces mirabilis]|uniref:GntR family transcriptional regulator n=1 Tax=Streptomyces mirabilis TaxID=68239 RepID=UPI0036D935C9
MAKAARYEQVADGIRQEIQAGTYAGGVGLGAGELAEKYDTTKATVSRALALLGDEGLLAPAGDGWTVVEAAVPEAPKVLEGRLVTEHVDPEAEKALKREDVAQAYQRSKDVGRAWLAAEGRATEAKKEMARKLMDLRELFKHKGHPDWNGDSRPYQALVSLLYQDLGVEPPHRRAILHHVEDLKRERVPLTLWGKFGVQALTRGQRAGLERRATQALTSVTETAGAAADQAAKGKATGHQLVTLMSRIDQGMAVFSTASLRVMTPAQRKKFRDQAQEARDRADALLNELDGLEE